MLLVKAPMNVTIPTRYYQRSQTPFDDWRVLNTFDIVRNLGNYFVIRETLLLMKIIFISRSYKIVESQNENFYQMKE